MLINKDTLLPWRADQRLGGVLYPANIEELWSDVDLAAINLYKPEKFVVPTGQTTTGPVRYEWTGTIIREVYSVAPIAYTVDDVKIEAQRRIIALVGTTDLQKCIIKQLNILMRANELVSFKQDRVWTTAEIAEAASLQALATNIKNVRAKSNAIELLIPIPADYTADARWV